MFEIEPPTTSLIDALFDVELARQLDYLDNADSKKIEKNQKAPTKQHCIAFLHKLLSDAKRFVLDTKCIYFANMDELRVSIENGQFGRLRIDLNSLSKLADKEAETFVLSLCEDDDRFVFKSSKLYGCDFLSKHNFVKNESQFIKVREQCCSSYLTNGFEFELSWFSDWIETTNKLVVENSKIRRLAHKNKKIAKLKNESQKEFA